MYPAIERIRELFAYNPVEGILTRKFNLCGPVTGRFVKIDDGRYPTASVVWAHYYGEWPSLLIDHKDRHWWNNKINNLRKATIQQNSYNAERLNSSGIKGVYNCGRLSKPWQAQIRINGQKVNLGRFVTIEEAAEVYKQAALQHHGEFACLD